MLFFASRVRRLFQKKNGENRFGIVEFLKYVGPGLIVTVGFIDPGNWASNIAAGAQFGYSLLWVVTLSTIMLIILQHNVAHLGIVTGLCLSEALTVHTPKIVSQTVIVSAMFAIVSTGIAEILGAAIGLEMLFHIPIKLGVVLSSVLVIVFLFTNSYLRLERWIIGFVALVGISFIYELYLAPVDWHASAVSSVVPSLPKGAIIIVMSVLGAVVMPHNLFLHSEVIQSRQWNLEDDAVIKKQLRFEFSDTLLSMIIGFCINAAMIILAASTFYSKGINVTELPQAKALLEPLLGGGAGLVFAIALLLIGIASSVTAAMAGGSVFSGLFSKPYNIKEWHSKFGVIKHIALSAIIIFFIKDPFNGLIYSQMFLSMQLPITMFAQLYLTSSKKVMGKYVNSFPEKIVLTILVLIISYLNIILLKDLLS